MSLGPPQGSGGGGGGGTPDDNSVTSAKIVDGAVALADMADLANGKIIGRVTAGTGVPEATTVAAMGGLVSGGALGTPSSGTLTNCTGTAAGLTAGVASAVAVGGITGLGTGVATALAINVGTSGAPVTNGGALGTPSSGTLTNCSGTAASLTAGSCTKLATGSTDNAILRADGTGGGTSQGSVVTIADTTGVIDIAHSSGALKINGTQVVAAQQAIVAAPSITGDLSGIDSISRGGVEAAFSAQNTFNAAIIALLKAHGLMASS